MARNDVLRACLVYLMSIEELAEYIGESKRTIYRYIKTGDCPPFIRLNARNLKFDKQDVDKWLNSKKVYPRTDEDEGEE